MIKTKNEKTELKVLKLRKAGLTQKEIAKELSISQNKVKYIQLQLLNEGLIDRKVNRKNRIRTSENPLLKIKDYPFKENFKLPFTKMVTLWHFSTNERLGALSHLHPVKDIKKLTIFMRAHKEELEYQIKHLKESPIDTHNLSKKNFLHYFKIGYDVQTVARMLYLTTDEVMDTIRWLNLKENEKFRRFLIKPSVSLQGLSNYRSMQIHYNTKDDYEAAAILGTGHETWRLHKNYLLKQGILLSKQEYKRQIEAGLIKPVPSILESPMEELWT